VITPLSGTTVISLTHYLQGPSCAQFLADLGADVIKVERLGGAYERHWSGAESFVEDESVFFLLAGRNQRSVELDLRSVGGKEVLWRLVKDADVLVENFRPGVVEKLGFSYDAVKEQNPGLVYCSLSGFGSTGPSRLRPGQDLLIQSLSGLVALNGQAGSPPSPVGSAIVDQHAATLGALGVVSALLRRTKTGQGGRVDTNLLEASLDLQIEPFNYHLNGTDLYERSATGISTRFHQSPYGVFETSDGYITMSLSGGPAMARAFEDPEFASITKSDQFHKREAVNERIAEHVRRRPTAHWEQVFDREKIWNARVRDYDEVEADPQIAANETILEFDLPRAGHVRLLGSPVHFDGEKLPLRLLPPNVGENTDEVLDELGYSREAVHALRASGSIGPNRVETPFKRSQPEA
jgi:crotonobetainyl-CoA:carnitine CoA-transferase CaiB-like acyl-CoA transferase